MGWHEGHTHNVTSRRKHTQPNTQAPTGTTEATRNHRVQADPSNLITAIIVFADATHIGPCQIRGFCFLLGDTGALQQPCVVWAHYSNNHSWFTPRLCAAAHTRKIRSPSHPCASRCMVHATHAKMTLRTAQQITGPARSESQETCTIRKSQHNTFTPPAFGHIVTMLEVSCFGSVVI